MTRTSGQSGKEGSMSDTPARPVSPGRDLPARASLEHLRNEAKAHLRTLRKKKTAAGLAEAQLDVARRYGFSSWRALKTYVDALHSFDAQIIQAVQRVDVGFERAPTGESIS